MIKNLRVALVAVTLWFGIGTANAITPISFDVNGNSIFGNTVAGAFVDTFDFTIPAGFAGTGGASVISGFGVGFQNNVVFDSFSLYDDTTNTTLASGAAGSFWSDLSYVGLNVAHDFDLIVSGHLAPGFTSGSYAGNISVSPVPEPETYAMLLVGLSLVGFSLRRRNGLNAAAMN